MVWKRLCLLSGAWSFPFYMLIGIIVSIRIVTIILFVASVSIFIFNKRELITANPCFYVKKLKIRN